MTSDSAPLVTIVTPSYNQGRFIRATIESVLSQDYPHLEYLIVDGGSTDETAAIVGEYAGRLTWISEPDRGQSDAINKGFRRARGEIVAWLNSDDVILPGAVSRAVAALAAHPEAGAVYGEGYRMDETGRVTGRFPATEPFNLWKLVYLSDYILQQTVFFRRRVVEEVGYLDESLHYGMDWDLLIRIGKRHPLVYIPEYLGCLREYETAKTFSGGAARVRELRAILQRHTGLRYPPGYITYGLGSYQREWMNRLEHNSPRWLKWPATALLLVIYAATAYAIMRTLRNAQGWYPDGWAAPRLKWMLPPGSGVLRMRGELPPGRRGLAGQTLRIFSGGRLLDTAEVGWGKFELLIPAPGSNDAVELEVRASRYVRPRWGSEPSFRRLAYRLYSIEWAE
ncbi:MAG TPA: glycosyltransferase family 2 protein [Bryobacteraceae bacterium]|nr:glycosyltransferase family 2 protein [Bryobacteraceae bacterium]